MSVQALSLAFAIRGLSPSEKLVFLALANYANEKMQCWPSQETLAFDTELSSRTVWGALQGLEGRRMLSRVARKRSDGTRASDVITLHFAGELTGPDHIANSANTSRKSCELNSQTLPNQLAPVATLTTFEPSVREEPSVANALTREADDFPPNAFEIWYGRYPHKVGKAAALKAFNAVRRGRKATFAELMAGLDRYIRTKPPDRAWCNPATWLNGGRWEDEPAPEIQPSPPHGTQPRELRPTARQINNARAYTGFEIAAQHGRRGFGGT